MIENFIAVDVETANEARHSICQIGLAAYGGSNRKWTWSSLVNPEEPFEEGNVRIHGIRSEDVRSAPKFPSILETIAPSLGGQIIVSHTPFDCSALHQAAMKYGCSFPESRWVDTCEIARLAWPDLSSHALDVLCGHFSIELSHHDAASDAVACAEILTQAILHTRMGIEQLAKRVGLVAPPEHRLHRNAAERRYSAKLSMAGDVNGPLAGQVLVCTGDFKIGEPKLVQLAASLGCDVEDRFSKKRTTILVVGTRDPARFNGKVKSDKLLAAEAVAAKGKPIAILSEQEFLKLVQDHQPRVSAAGL